MTDFHSNDLAQAGLEQEKTHDVLKDDLGQAKSRTDTYRTNSIPGDGRVKLASFRETMNAFDTHMADGDYTAAADAISDAADTFAQYREDIQDGLKRAITRLSLVNGPAEPPHPRTLTLVNKQSTLTR